MADVRLTATNPADSSVVPVACNERGELKLEEIPDQSFDGNLKGDLNVQGSGDFTYTVTRSGRENIPSFVSRQNESNTLGLHYVAYSANSADPVFQVFPQGYVQFQGDPYFGRSTGVAIQHGKVMTCRSAITDHLWQGFLEGEQNPTSWIVTDGTAVFTGNVTAADICFNLEPTREDGPTLYVKKEILLIKTALQAVLEKLRMTPPAGWEVWDGSNENS